VPKYLNTRFQGQWIGRALPIAWPPHSPDLTPLHYFLRGLINDGLLYLLCLQMPLRYYVACGKKLTTGGTSATLPVEVTLNHNYPR
jgi:hypothetical protein